MCGCVVLAKQHTRSLSWAILLWKHFCMITCLCSALWKAIGKDYALLVSEHGHHQFFNTGIYPIFFFMVAVNLCSSIQLTCALFLDGKMTSSVIHFHSRRKDSPIYAQDLRHQSSAKGGGRRGRSFQPQKFRGAKFMLRTSFLACSNVGGGVPNWDFDPGTVLSTPLLGTHLEVSFDSYYTDLQWLVFFISRENINSLFLLIHLTQFLRSKKCWIFTEIKSRYFLQQS